MRNRLNQQYASLQAGRGLAALLVVLFHVTTFVGGDARYWHIRWLSDRLSGLALGVDYFFVLSGTVLLLAHRKDVGRPATLLSYAWKRVRRVYPIYWIVLGAVVMQYARHPGMGAAWQTSPRTLLAGLTLVHLRGYSTDLNLPVAWTLFHEVLFYTVFATLLLHRRLGLAVLGGWSALSIAALFCRWPLFFGAYLFSPLHLLFVAGMLAAFMLRRRRAVPAAALTVAGLSLFAGAIAWSGLRGDVNMPLELLAGLGATLTVAGAARLEERGRLTVPAALRFLGDSSYSLYLVHYPLFMAVAPLLYRAWRLHPATPVAVPFAALAFLAVVAGNLLHVFIERPLLRLLSNSPQPVVTAGETSVGSPLGAATGVWTDVEITAPSEALAM